MKCPKCDSVELKKTGYHSPSTCKNCGGMWLERMEGSGPFSFQIDEVPLNSETENHDQKTGICPSGHGIMIRAKVDLDEPFYLEKCTACGGIWFDRGEWLRIVENNLADNISHIWSRSWQRKQSQERDRKSFIALNQRLLGERIFNAVMDLAKELGNHSEKDRAIALLQQEINQIR